MRWLVAVVSVAFIGGATAHAEFAFGEYRLTVGGLSHPTGVAAQDGLVAIVETDRNCVSILDPESGAPRRIGEPGTEPGQLLAPEGVAFAPDGGIVVADTGNHRVQRFDKDGNVLWSTGRKGRGAGAFARPRGVAMRGERIVVADTGNHRFVVLDADGTPQMAIGGFGDEDGAFNRPTGVALDEFGAIFVTDSGNDRVQRFGPLGEWEATFGVYGPFAGMLDEPAAVAVSGRLVHVADRRNHRVTTFTRDGTFLSVWGRHALSLREGEGALHYPAGIAIDESTNTAAVVEPLEDRCQFVHARAADAPIPAFAPPPQDPRVHFGTRIDVDGRLIAIAEPERHRVFLFEGSREIPVVVGDFGERGETAGLLRRTQGIALDAGRAWYFCGDPDKRRLQRLDIDWNADSRRAFKVRRMRFAKAWDLAALTPSLDADLAWTISPSALRFGPDGAFFIVDDANGVVLRTDTSLTSARVIGRDELEHPVDVQIAADGSIFVVDSDLASVLVFAPDGTLLRSLSSGLERPMGVAIAANGDAFVSDRVQHAIVHFRADGTLAGRVAGPGTEHGQLWKPAGVAIDQLGRVMVVDHGNHRGQAFSPEGAWQLTFGTGRAYTANDQPMRRQPVKQDDQDRNRE